LIQVRTHTVRVHKRDEQGEQAIVPGAGLWTSMLDRALARRLAEEMEQEKRKERDDE